MKNDSASILGKPKKTILVKVSSNEALPSKSDLATKDKDDDLNSSPKSKTMVDKSQQRSRNNANTNNIATAIDKDYTIYKKSNGTSKDNSFLIDA